jgi:hypothetical protein
MSTPQSAIVDATRLQEFVGKMVVDMSAAMSGALALIGDKLGPFFRIGLLGVPAAGLDTDARRGQRQVGARRQGGRRRLRPGHNGEDMYFEIHDPSNKSRRKPDERRVLVRSALTQFDGQ